MNSIVGKIKSIKKDLKSSIAQSSKVNVKMSEQLAFIYEHWGDYTSAPAISKLLRSEHREVRYFASISLRISGNLDIIPALMKAIVAPENIGYAAPYVWACSEFDCTKYLPFFFKLIINSDDAGDVTWGSLAVIENMQGPFDKVALKKMISKLLRVAVPETSSHKLLHELLFAETGSVLHEFLFNRIYLEWKKV